jgi:mono/diheme cytochrome c family protein
MKINIRFAFSILAVLVVISCSKKIATTTTTTAPAPVTDPIILAKITEGKSLYESNCNKCHGLHNPGKYNEQQWTKHLDRMAPKAKISDEQKETIFAYLSNNAKH